MEEKKKAAVKASVKKEDKAELAESSKTKEVATPAFDDVKKSDTSKGDDEKNSGRGLSRHGWLVAGGTIAALLVVFLLVFGVLIYKYKSDSRLVQIVSSVVPYPAERVNNNLITYANYLFEVNSIKHYYQSQTTEDNKPAVDFNTKDGKDRLKQLRQQVLDQLQQESVVRKLAAQYKVTVSDKEINDQVDQITKSAGGTPKVKEVLKKYYGWDIADLKKKISFQLLKQKTSEKLQNSESINAQSKAKAESVLKEVKAGGDFGELAKKYSQDSSAANGGDLGFFGKGQMVKEFEDAAFKLQPGETSGLVKTKYGYHIIKLTEFNADKTQAHASHILIKGIDFDQYLKDQLKKDKVQVYVKP